MTKETECSTKIVCKRYDGDLVDSQNNPLKQALAGDTYVIGKLWIDLMNAALVGRKFTFFPTVKAAAPKEAVPQKPPPMKYTDLPLYECPHAAYKQYLADKEKHPYRNYKILHKALLPTVKEYRKDFNIFLAQAKKELGDTYDEVTTDLATAKKRVIATLRDPDNLALRQGLVAIGGLSGLFFSRRKSLVIKLLGVSTGLLIAGSLTFPEESDEAFRTVLYRVGHVGFKVYGFINSCFNMKLREKTPCSRDGKME